MFFNLKSLKSYFFDWKNILSFRRAETHFQSIIFEIHFPPTDVVLKFEILKLKMIIMFFKETRRQRSKPVLESTHSNS